MGSLEPTTIYNIPNTTSLSETSIGDKARAKAIKDVREDFRIDKENLANAKKQLDNRGRESLLKIKKISQNHLSRILFKARTVFPFDFFPNELRICSTKIEVLQNTLLNAFSQRTFLLKDIVYAEINSSFFFSTLRIVNNTLPHLREDPITLNYLRNGDAVQAKKIIDGLLIANASGVDISAIEPRDLLPHIEALAN